MPKIKLWVEHPDEPEALQCIDSFMTSPVRNVDADVANPLARWLGLRFVNVNMSRAFPGDPDSSQYEERQAARVVRESAGYDVVASLHTFREFGASMGAVDSKQGASPVVLGFLRSLGLKNVVLTSYGGLQGHVPNGCAVEMDPKGLGGDIERLRAVCNQLANGPRPTAGVADFGWFKHLASSNIAQLDPNQLSEQTREGLRDFEPLPDEFAARLGFEGLQVHLMTWRYTPNPQGYWGELVTPMAPPDDALWPQQ